MADQRSSVLKRLFVELSIEAAWFAPSFLAQVPVERLSATVRDLKQRYGDFLSVAVSESDLIVRLARSEVATRLLLDPQGRIAGLMFEAPVPTTGALDDHVRSIAGLPGRSAVLLTIGRVQRAGHAADMPLAVGSAFKLAVLRATADAVEDGRLTWDRVVHLDPLWRSLPSGILQDWLDGTPVTVATLANLMI